MGVIASFLKLFSSSNNLVTKNGEVYNSIEEDEIPNWVMKRFERMEKRGALWGSFKGKNYRYIIKYEGHNGYSCWRRLRAKK